MHMDLMRSVGHNPTSPRMYRAKRTQLFSQDDWTRSRGAGKVVAGVGSAPINEVVKIVPENESVCLPKGAVQRLENQARSCSN